MVEVGSGSDDEVEVGGCSVVWVVGGGLLVLVGRDSDVDVSEVDGSDEVEDKDEDEDEVEVG